MDFKINMSPSNLIIGQKRQSTDALAPDCVSLCHSMGLCEPCPNIPNPVEHPVCYFYEHDHTLKFKCQLLNKL